MTASITIFSDVILPSSIIAAGVRGRQIRRNTRTPAANGRVRINIDWARTLRQYDLGIVPMLISAWQTLEGLHEVTEGGAYGLLMQDPKDHTVLVAEGLLYPYNASALTGTIGLGYGVPSYRLHKRYTAAGSARTKDRLITRPLASPAITRGGSAVTLGAGAGNAAVDLDTGIVTFVADSSSTVTAVTVGATTQVTLTAALSGVAVGERLYLSGLGGTVASTLNGLSHAISAISGGGSNVYTLTVATTGLAWTSGGSGYAYPQSTEALAWSGQFYVPVHFVSDEIDWELARSGPYDGRLVAGPNVSMMEVPE